ncbi:MAG: YkgJ family cysteine cluster protein [Gemmataceae bacterium]
MNEAGYECDECGMCCKSFPIFASQADAQREPRVASEGRRLPMQMVDDRWTYRLYPLPFLDSCPFAGTDRRCTIYATRPTVCREMPAGGLQCQDARRRHGLPPLLPVGSPGTVS